MSLRDTICKMCGHMIDEGGNVIGVMVFGKEERGPHLCKPCNEETRAIQESEQWPSR